MSVRPTYDPHASAAHLSPDMPHDTRARYRLLRLQKGNQIYRRLSTDLRGVLMPEDFAKIRAVENPALQAVVFHVMHVFPGPLGEALPLDLPSGDPLREVVERILRWSWFGTQKDNLVDTATTLGDAFIRARSSGDRVGMQVRDPDDVTEFEEDGEGNITYLRLDVEEAGEGGAPEFYTEAWSRDENLYAQWTHNLGVHAPYAQLPAPEVESPISEFGHDFVPYVRASFREGYRASERSDGVFEPHREAIDELLRSGTVMRDRFFRHGKPLWQSVTEQEKPVDYVEEMARQQRQNDSKEVESARFPDLETFIRNPRGTRLEAMVPSIDWSAGLAQIDDLRLALERSMSELRFARGHDKGAPSGAAIDKHRDPAVRRARAARGNFEEAILQAVKMCVTMGQGRGLFDEGIGRYERGDFDSLSFKARPIVPPTEAEQTAADTAKAEMYAALREVSPELLRLRLVEDGYDEDTAQRIADSGPGRLLNGTATFGGAG